MEDTSRQDYFITDDSNANLQLEGVNPRMDEDEVLDQSALSKFLQTSKRAGQMAVVLCEFTPVNEAMRLSAFTAGEVMTHSPVVGALTFGLSTLAIEGSAALASASLLDTHSSKRFNGYLKSRLSKVGYKEESEISATTIVAGTFVGGSVVGMALRNFNHPDATIEENRRFGLMSAAWLAGVCAVGGAVGSEAISYTIDNPKTVAAVSGVAAVAALGRKAKKMFTGRKADNLEQE